ncbi:MAG: hypothetical protein ACHQHN_08020 [Sphingobacteriales bacterium]
MSVATVDSIYDLTIASSRVFADRFVKALDDVRNKENVIDKPVSGQYYNAALTCTHRQLDELLSLLNNERRSTAINQNLNQSLYKGVLKDWVGQIFGISGIENHIALMTSIKESISDYMQEKIANGLFFLFKRERVTKTDLHESAFFSMTEISDVIPDAINEVARSTRSLYDFHDYYKQSKHTFDIDYSHANTDPNIANLTRLFADFPDYDDAALKSTFKAWLEDHTDEQVESTFDDTTLESYLRDAYELLKKNDTYDPSAINILNVPNLPLPPTFWTIKPWRPEVDAHGY